MTSSTLLFEVEKLFEIKETSLFLFLFEAPSVDAINPNIRSLGTNVLLSSVSASFALANQKFHYQELQFFSFYRLSYTLNLPAFFDVVGY